VTKGESVMRDTVLFKVPNRVVVYIDRVKMIDTTNDDEMAHRLLKDRSYYLVTADNNPPEDNMLAAFWREDHFEFPPDLSLVTWLACVK